MQLDPKKLAAFIARENNAKPLQSNAMMDEDEEGNPNDDDMDLDEGNPNDDDDDDEDEEITEEEIEDIAEMIDEGKGDPQLLELTDELLDDMEEFGDEAENPPAWAASPAIWEKAEKAVDPEGKGSKYTEPYAVVSHVYRKMGGTVS